MKLYLPILALICSFSAFSQSSDNNPISTAVPFLDYCANARLGAFGEIGSVSSAFYPDAGMYQNPALLATNGRYAGGNLSYSPYSRNFADDSFIIGLNGFYSFNASNAIAYNEKYFDLGNIEFADENGTSIGGYHMVEALQQFTYSHVFKNGVSVGGGIKHIWSDPGIKYIAGVEVKPANAFAIDLGFSYRKGIQLTRIFVLNLNVGANINNFGSKIKYVSDDEGDFLPTTLRIGFLINPELRLGEKFTLGMDVAYQAEKLLVPTPPEYAFDDAGNWVIEKGMDPDVSPFRALYQSFYDAPGGFEEEMHEIIHKLATEVRLVFERKFYAAGRIGKFMEHASKGTRDHFSWGAGMGVYGFSLDFSKYVSDNQVIDSRWLLTFGFRTTITNPVFRF